MTYRSSLAAALAAFIVAAIPQSLSAQSFLGGIVELPTHHRLLSRMQSNPAPLTSFRSDGCSGGMSDGWAFFAANFPAFAKVHGGQPPWEHCCLAHDRRYHAGPSRNSDARTSLNLRKAADEEAKQCIVRTAAAREQALANAYGISRGEVALIYRSIGEVIYRGVRAGGLPCTGLAWRWGFGLPNC